MSRIIGVTSPIPYNQLTTHGETMISACLQPGWSSTLQSAGQAVFGWGGWRQAKIAVSRGVLVVIDGSIYNREDLGSVSTDASLFIELYRKYGFEEALCRLNGDFAVALYDTQSNTLWLGRDRFGIKPLFYMNDPQRFAFSSRLRPLFSIPGIRHDVNRQYVALFAASHYRYFDNAPHQSPYQAISQLPAAHCLRYKNGQVTVKPYWSLQDKPDFDEPLEALAERYRDLLLDAVSIRLKAAKRPAFTLSGGMDSSSVLASAVYASGVKQHAFSTVYADKTYDESAEIRSMLDSTVTQWHPVAVDEPDVFGLVSQMITLHDEPVATATWLSHYLLCQETRAQGFGGLFGGLGGDELNAGEYEHFYYFFADLRTAGLETRLDSEVAMWVQYHDHPIFRKSKDFMERELSRLVDLNTAGKCLPDRKRIERYASTLNPEYFDLRAFEPVMEHPFHSYLKNRTFQDMTRETIPCCLRAEDRQTTAFALDNYLPFFDYRLVEFMFRVPSETKYNMGVAKHSLRQAMRGILPEETRLRVKKTGWNAPAHRWFSGKGKDALLDLVNSQAFAQRGIYHLGEVRRLIKEHDEILSSGRMVDNHMMFLWQLVNLELWFLELDKERGGI